MATDVRRGRLWEQLGAGSGFGQIDVVVNNAGYGHFGAIEELTDHDLRQQFDVNVFGTLHVIRAVLPQRIDAAQRRHGPLCPRDFGTNEAQLEPDTKTAYRLPDAIAPGCDSPIGSATGQPVRVSTTPADVDRNEEDHCAAYGAQVLKAGDVRRGRPWEQCGRELGVADPHRFRHLAPILHPLGSKRDVRDLLLRDPTK